MSFEFVLEVARDQKLSAWSVAEEYLHEAYEHAALVEVGSAKLLKEIQYIVEPFLYKAMEHIEKLLKRDLAQEKQDEK